MIKFILATIVSIIVSLTPGEPQHHGKYISYMESTANHSERITIQTVGNFHLYLNSKAGGVQVSIGTPIFVYYGEAK